MDKWRICPECKGAGELICANCGGIGCHLCEGAGRVRCDRCGGYFEIRIEEDYSLKGIMRSIDKRLHGLLHTKKQTDYFISQSVFFYSERLYCKINVGT